MGYGCWWPRSEERGGARRSWAARRSRPKARADRMGLEAEVGREEEGAGLARRGPSRPEVAPG
jgi:hypothetical protein